MILCHTYLFFFFFNDTATTEIYTLSLHDALPIWCIAANGSPVRDHGDDAGGEGGLDHRSEEHTSELQSQSNLVCRLLLEKKKKKQIGPASQQKGAGEKTDTLGRSFVTRFHV